SGVDSRQGSFRKGRSDRRKSGFALPDADGLFADSIDAGARSEPRYSGASSINCSLHRELVIGLELPMELELHTRRLQDIGLNAYESRAYLVLIGHSHFKALEVAGRARIPRQKIYEVLDSLVEKGFVRVVQGKAKQFSAVEPRLAMDSYLQRRKER